MKTKPNPTAILDLLALMLIGIGAWWLSPAWSLIAVGAILYGTHLLARILTGAKQND